MEDKIVCGDCLEIIKTIQDGTFDAVITDPPYQQEAHGRGLAGKREIYKKMSEWTNMENDWYNKDFLKELCRVCKFPNVFLFGGKRDLFKVLQFAEENWLNYYILPICKKSPMPTTNNTWLSNEFAVHITDRKLTYSKSYSDKVPYFMAGQNKETAHPNEKSVSHLMRIVQNITPEGGLVLDCFAGSGTTGIACMRTKRNFFMVEKNTDFVEMIQKRIEQEKAQMSLF